MADRKAEPGTTRRTFFRTLVAGAGAAGALAATATKPEAAEAQGARPDGTLGYRETEHVKRVYASQRF